MRLIRTKDTNTPPISIVNAQEEQERIALTRDLDSISEKNYKGDKIEITDINDPYYGDEEFEVRYILRQLFYNKCAYCERTEYKPDVEHYRPKKKVTGSQRNNHGYYWLCYEWTNLLPACRDCNSGNGKWNKFPVAENRITSPPIITVNNLAFDKCKANSIYLQSEKPLLIHPEIDEPAHFFKLEWNGRLTALDGVNGKGKVSIDTYDLNRGNLTEARKEIVDNLKEQIKIDFSVFRNRKLDASIFQERLILHLKRFQSKSAESTQYSFVYFFICQHFTKFVTENFPYLSDLEKQVLIASFPVVT